VIRVLVLFALAGTAYAADLRVTVRDQQGRPVADAVVVALPEGGAPRPAQPRTDAIEQIDLEFVPGVKAIQVGTAVSFPNRDDVRHHVYSFSPPKRFELPLYAGTPAKPVLFDVPGVVTIGCNIHDWMVGYIYVSESPYFATTSAQGRAQLAGLPAGQYLMRVWHPQIAEAEESRRALGAAESAAVEWRIALKPERRVRRAPAAGRGSRY
jgi:plastocyanin